MNKEKRKRTRKIKQRRLITKDGIRKHQKQHSARLRRRRRKRKKLSLKHLILIPSCILILVGVGGLLIYWHHISVQNNKLENLAEIVDDTVEINNSTGNSILPKYAVIYDENNDLFGWIGIDGTKINYPVMHTPKEPEKYLRTNFEGKYSQIGLPFIEGDCSKDSDNLLIYAHNMKDGSMFHSLLKYKDKDYWVKHSIINFDTLYEEKEYEVMSVFYDRVYNKSDDVFKFYNFIDAEDKEDYENAINYFEEKQLYDTDVKAEYGDQLITLVTCSYHEDNGRFVVVAREIQK